MKFSRQEYWSELPFLLQGIFPTQGFSLCFLHLPHWQADSLPLCHLGYPTYLQVELLHHRGFPGGSDGEESACNVGDLASIPGLGRSPGGEHGNTLQYSCLENSHGQRSLAGYSPWNHRVGHDWSDWAWTQSRSEAQASVSTVSSTGVGQTLYSLARLFCIKAKGNLSLEHREILCEDVLKGFAPWKGGFLAGEQNCLSTAFLL